MVAGRSNLQLLTMEMKLYGELRQRSFQGLHQLLLHNIFCIMNHVVSTHSGDCMVFLSTHRISDIINEKDIQRALVVYIKKPRYMRLENKSTSFHITLYSKKVLLLPNAYKSPQLHTICRKLVIPIL